MIASVEPPRVARPRKPHEVEGAWTLAVSENPEDMYREHVLDHYKNPRNFGHLDPADVDYVEDNPLCGDEIRITARVSADGRFEVVRFEGHGCAISQAAASLLTTHVTDRALPEVDALTREQVVAMLGIPVSPVRLKCALLAHSALTKGVAAYEESRGA